MGLQATFPPGVAAVTVNGLHQWDYGRALEIRADDLPAIVEIHFACHGMKDAVVRSCSVIDGVATAIIPDRCLEQTSPITAWVYKVGETSGATTRTIALPIVARPRPQTTATIPDNFSDKYTQAVAGFNKVVEDAKVGNLTVAKSVSADHAEHATKADDANFADCADQAYWAQRVVINGKNPFQAPTETPGQLEGAGYYCIFAEGRAGISSPVFVYWDGSSTLFCGVIGEITSTGETVLDTLYIEGDGSPLVQRTSNGSASPVDEYNFKIVKLWG